MLTPALRGRTVQAAVLSGLLAVGSIAAPLARAQTPGFALWDDSSGDWDDQNHWFCSDSTGTVTGPCIPDGNYFVAINSGTVTLRSSKSIFSVSANAGTFNLINATLSTNDPQGGITVEGTLNVTDGSITAAKGIGGGNLTAINSTLVVTDGQIDSKNTELRASFLSSLSMGGRLTMINSEIANNGSTPSRMVIAGPSSIKRSNVTSVLRIVNGGDLVIDEATTFDTLVESSQSLNISQGSLTIRGGSTVNAGSQPVSLGFFSSTAPASLLVEGQDTVLNLDSAPLEIRRQQTTVTVRDHGTINGTNATDLFIGDGAGLQTEMTVSTGGSVTVRDVFINSAPMSFARLSIKDLDSQFTAQRNFLVIGGSVSVTNQAQFTAKLLTVDDGNTAGEVNVETGAKMTLTADSQLSDAVIIGANGVGVLNVRSGGQGTAVVPVRIGDGAGSNGTLLVTDSDSKWENGDAVIVGYAGTGTLRIENLGQLSSLGAGPDQVSGIIGFQDGSTGTATVSGGTWTNQHNLQVGKFGTGTLTIEARGQVRDADAVLGVEDHAVGTVTVRGQQSLWTNDGRLTVGFRGQGTVSVESEGRITSREAVIGGAFASSTAGPTSTVTVSGIGSLWDNAERMTIGGLSNGALTVINNARVNTGEARIGQDSFAVGTVTVAGGDSQWRSSGELIVGVNGTGQLRLLDRGRVFAQTAVIAQHFGPLSFIEVSQGATLNVAGDIAIGSGGRGELRVSVEGVVRSGGAHIGGLSGSQGLARLVQGSRWDSTGVIVVGGAGARGDLEVQDGSRLTAPEVIVNPTGTLNGNNGVIAANITNNGGVVTPGDAHGLMTIEGNYIQNSGMLVFELGGPNPGEFDELVVNGRIELNGGNIQIKFGNGFQPLAGQTFSFLSSTQGFLGSVAVDVVGLGSNLSFDDTFTGNGVSLTFVSAPVPEPSTWVLLGAGLVLLVGVRRVQPPRR